MQNKSLHIISFDNPFPPVYGGVIDVFYKIKALHELGFEIYLHCFVNEIPENRLELNRITKAVFFYRLSLNPLLFFSKIPYSIISRNHKDLLTNLNKNEAPILFEGLKTTYLISVDGIQTQTKILRLHNIEQDYFFGISKTERSIIRKISFYLEGLKYKKYENIIQNFDKVISISRFENDYVNENFKNSIYVPVFHGNKEVIKLENFGDYSFYHGDLNTADNRQVVRFLVSVFKKMPNYKLLISSGSNEKFVKKLIKNCSNISFESIQDFAHLKELLKNAHINISWSFQKSGTKLKLINSLFNSRFSIINQNIVDDDLISNLCHQVRTKDELISKIIKLSNEPFNDFDYRKLVLESHLNDRNNAKLIANFI